MSDSKKVWKGIRQLVNLKSRSCSTPTKLLVEDVEINDPKSITDVFSNLFANIGNNLTKNVPSVNTPPPFSISQLHPKVVSISLSNS